MPAYRVTIDGRSYEGEYGGKPEAVYGCMLKDQIDRHRAASAKMPRHDRKKSDAGARGRDAFTENEAAGCTWAAYDEAKETVRREDASTSRITVTEVRTGRKVTKKVHRVE